MQTSEQILFFSHSKSSEEVFIHLNRILEDLERFLISKKSEGNESMTIEYFEKLLWMYFPQKKAIEIADLVDRVQSFACSGKEVNISRLFHQTDSAESHFVRLLWRQGLNERDLLLQLLQVISSCFTVSLVSCIQPGCRFQVGAYGRAQGNVAFTNHFKSRLCFFNSHRSNVVTFVAPFLQLIPIVPWKYSRKTCNLASECLQAALC